jgi:hypothetical protein
VSGERVAKLTAESPGNEPSYRFFARTVHGGTTVVAHRIFTT